MKVVPLRVSIDQAGRFPHLGGHPR